MAPMIGNIGQYVYLQVMRYPHAPLNSVQIKTGYIESDENKRRTEYLDHFLLVWKFS